MYRVILAAHVHDAHGGMTQSDWLVFGASGAVGRFLLGRLAARDETVLAVSRRGRPAWSAALTQVRWTRLDLFGERLDRGLCAARVLSAGPLDGFVDACLQADWPAGTRVVALSSMSAVTKQDSPDPAERALARRLVHAEEALVDAAAARGWRVTLLRPTLIWGAGMDRSLTALVELGRQWGMLPLPRGARGLRQPVHADDLAQAMIAAAGHPDLDRAVLPLPGGEALPFCDMLARSLAVAAPQVRLVQVPDLLAWPAIWLLGRLPGRAATLSAQLGRTREDLQVRDASGWERLGIVPRAFAPSANAFEPPDDSPFEFS